MFHESNANAKTIILMIQKESGEVIITTFCGKESNKMKCNKQLYVIINQTVECLHSKYVQNKEAKSR